MYAVVQSGGKQHKVRVGDSVLVEKLSAAAAVGDRVELDQILMIGQDDQTLVGRPTVPGARIVATVADPDHKGEKLIIFKYKAKVRYRRKTGHRQHYTRLVIDDILTGDDSAVRESAVTGEDAVAVTAASDETAAAATAGSGAATAERAAASEGAATAENAAPAAAATEEA